MKTVFIFLLLFTTTIFAGTTQKYADSNILNSNIKIIDIRTAPEWVETGIVKNSILITFFDERGGYDVMGFLNKLNKKIKKDETFALICRTGSRTKVVADFLGKSGYNVINLIGGVVYARSTGVNLVPYKN